MINKLEIENFQSHKKSVLEFDPGVNIIIGKTDSGKSAIIRSLKFVTFNKPTGDSFLPLYWEGKTKVKVVTDSGEVIRNKGSQNSYVVNGTKLTAFGTNVPDEVQKVLNMNEVNFQYQIDLPFLISNTSGEVGQFLNRIANLSVIDVAIKKIKSWLKSLNNDLQYQQQIVEDKQAEIASYDVEKYEADVEIAEQLFKDFKKLQNDKAAIKELLDRYKSIDVRKKAIKKEVSGAHLVDEGLRLIKEIKALKTRAELLKNYIERNKDIAKKLKVAKNKISLEKSVDAALKNTKQYNELLTKAEKLEAAIKTYKRLAKQKVQIKNKLSLETQVKTTIKQIDKVNEIVEKANALEELITSYKKVNKQKAQKKKLFQSKDKEYHDNYPDICPFCGSKVK